MPKENPYYTDSIKRELAIGVKVTGLLAKPVLASLAPIAAELVGGRVKNCYWYHQSQKKNIYL